MVMERARGSAQRVPPLGRKNYQWWARTYGTRPASGTEESRAKSPLDGVKGPTEERHLDGEREAALFDAIRTNRVAQVERRVVSCPAIAITKVSKFGRALLGREAFHGRPAHAFTLLYLRTAATGVCKSQCMVLQLDASTATQHLHSPVAAIGLWWLLHVLDCTCSRRRR